jgi:hypothetical protein
LERKLLEKRVRDFESSLEAVKSEAAEDRGALIASIERQLREVRGMPSCYPGHFFPDNSYVLQ